MQTERRQAQRVALWTGLLAIGASCAVVAWAAGRSAPSNEAEEAAATHWNGYVEDQLCSSCHAEIAASYQTHGMARSFARAENASRVELLPSPLIRDQRLTYQVTRRGEDLIFAQWQTAADGSPIHRWETRIDWAVGSATNARVYLAQSADGRLVELPIAWFAQTGEWGAKPGTARRSEAGFRLISRECMFCHTAVPPVPEFQDHRFANQNFPLELPEGIGCQRCHGPGLRHVEEAKRAQTAMATARAAGERLDAPTRRALRDAIRNAVVEPSSLGPERRRDVCAQCHHQPSINLFGIRRIDRQDYEFAAGESLDEFLLKVEVNERLSDGTLLEPSHRFEINHHAYRLERSPCFTESPVGALECTQCHDPHRHLNEAETKLRARTTCMTCHDPSLEARPFAGSESVAAEHFAADDCVACHMPRRRTQDIVEVAMTDHRIQRRAAPEQERLAPLAPRRTQAEGVRPLDPDDGGPFDAVEMASGGISQGLLELADDLERQLPRVAAAHPEVDFTEPRLRLAQARLLQGRLPEARALLSPLPERPDAAQQARVWMSMIAARENRPQEALEFIEQAIAAAGLPGDGDLFLRRGRLRLWAREPGACEDLERSVALNELVAEAWFLVGRCRVEAGRPQAALTAWQTALGIDPDMRRAAAPLAALLRALGREAEALRVMSHHGLTAGGG